MKSKPQIKLRPVAVALLGFYAMQLAGCIVEERRHSYHPDPPPPAVRADVIVR
jgi:hypothetical protein